MDSPPELGRGLFGYRRSTVTRLLSDRDTLLRQAEGRARAAEEKFSELSAQMAALREEMRQRDQEIEELRARTGLGEPGVELAWQRGPVTADAVSDELSAVLHAADAVNEQISSVLRSAEESASRIVEGAQKTTRKQVEEAERLWREVRQAYERFVQWQERLVPVLRSFQSDVTDLRSRMQELPGRIQEAFIPLSDSIATAGDDIESLRATWKPPLLAGLPDDERGAEGRSLGMGPPEEAPEGEAAEEVPASPDWAVAEEAQTEAAQPQPQAASAADPVEATVSGSEEVAGTAPEEEPAPAEGWEEPARAVPNEDPLFDELKGPGPGRRGRRAPANRTAEDDQPSE